MDNTFARNLKQYKPKAQQGQNFKAQAAKPVEKTEEYQMKDNTTVTNKTFISDIRNIIIEARHKAYSAINTAMVEAYWLTGKRIVEEEQGGKERADYGKQILKELSAELTKEFGKGFSVGSLYYYRQFYTTFPDIFATPWRILSWSHYKRLMQVSDSEARTWYASKYMTYMPTEEELRREIEQQKEFFRLQHNKEDID